MSDYSNILNALNSKPQSKLTPAQEVANYSAFSDLQKQGVYLPDVMEKLKELDELKKRLDSIEKAAPAVDEAVFSTMEAAVAKNASVAEARKRMEEAESAILKELCMKDPRYKDAVDAYRAMVNREYVKAHEKKAKDEDRVSASTINTT